MGRRSEEILLVSYFLPSRWHGGGLRLLDLYSLIRQACPQARLSLVAAKFGPGDTPEAEVDAIFDSVHLLNVVDFNPEGFAAAGLLSKSYDVVDFQYLQSGRLIRAYRDAGARKIIFSPMESLVRSFSTSFGRFRLTRASLRHMWANLTYAAEELRFVFSADRVLCVSHRDARVLRRFRWWGGISAIETGVSPLEFPASLGATPPARDMDGVQRVVFVAFFGSATNVEALKWYLQEVHPLVLQAVPGYRFQVVGRGLELGSAQGDSVDVIGDVERIEPCLNGAWVGIAPALSGAGLRGKINQYAVAGVPCVASTLAAEGLAYRDGESISMASDAAVFAKHCIRLLSYPVKNMEMGLAAREVCLANYVWEARAEQVSQLYCECPSAVDHKN